VLRKHPRHLFELKPAGSTPLAVGGACEAVIDGDWEALLEVVDGKVELEIGSWLSAAFSSAEQKFSDAGSRAAAWITATRRPYSAELAKKAPGIAPALAARTAASSAAVNAVVAAPPRPA
jgi:hypothetical protein